MAMAEHQQQRPSVAKVLALITLLPVGGGLLGLSGVTLAFTVLGLAVATPLFLLCSPVLVPAVVMISLAVMGFLASGAMGLTGLSSLSWILDWLKRLPELIEQAKHRMGEAAGHATHRAREAGQSAQSKVQESSR